MSEKKSYAGKISNAGAQHVEAPNKRKKTPNQSKILKGKDLRVKNGKG